MGPWGQLSRQLHLWGGHPGESRMGDTSNGADIAQSEQADL